MHEHRFDAIAQKVSGWIKDAAAAREAGVAAPAVPMAARGVPGTIQAAP